MATNPLVSAQEIIGGSASGMGLGQVVTIQNTQVQVLMETGQVQTVFGSNVRPGDWVVVRDNQILGTIASEDATVVYVP